MIGMVLRPSTMKFCVRQSSAMCSFAKYVSRKDEMRQQAINVPASSIKGIKMYYDGVFGIGLRHRSPFRCYGSSDENVAQGEEQQQEGAATSPKPLNKGRVVSGNQKMILPVQGMKLERVERLGEEAWAGVANVDRGVAGIGMKNTAILVGGDATMLLVFATIGRLSHGEPMSLLGSLGVALPFMVGWYSAAGLLGGYKKQALESALVTGLTCWAAGIPGGLLIRSVSKGYFPDTTFILISMATTGLFLVGWRAAYAAIASPLDSSLTPQEQLKRRRDKKGNPFEFISLLISLVKRW